MTGTASPGTTTTSSETRSSLTPTTGRTSSSSLSSLATSSVRPGASQTALPSSAVSSSVPSNSAISSAVPSGSAVSSSALSSASGSASASASAPASSASSGPLSCPIRGNPTRRDYRLGSWRVNKRAPVVHPPGKSDVTLFHGTDFKKDAESFSKGITLQTSNGDLHDEVVPGVDGGLYMTDSFMAAAQFACRKSMPSLETGDSTQDEVYVVELAWRGSGLEVKDFKDDAEFKKFLERNDKNEDPTVYPGDRDPALDKIMIDNAMISGPMNAPGADAGLTKDFWQYAAIKMQPIREGKLTYVATHKVLCRNIPVGNKLSSDDYSEGQRCNAGFPGILEKAQAKTGTVNWEEEYAALPE